MIDQPLSDEYFMKKAFEEAKTAFDKNEVPVGAIIVCKNKIIARAHNLTEQLTDFTAHAEMQVFTSASEYLQNKYLNECTLYVTLEPCLMCAGAAFWTRIGRIVYGASDAKRGFLSQAKNALHPSTVIKGGVLEDECSSIIKNFFINKRINPN
mgnify:FL=1|tara:strand:+ start:479 stop:937 length:459 start_codon:yes stop_codon:yes gene_type:complete